MYSICVFFLRESEMVRSKIFLTVVALLAMVAVAQAQQRGRGGMSRNSLLGLLGREQVQTEMKLTEAQKSPR